MEVRQSATRCATNTGRFAFIRLTCLRGALCSSCFNWLRGAHLLGQHHLAAIRTRRVLAVIDYSDNLHSTTACGFGIGLSYAALFVLDFFLRCHRDYFAVIFLRIVARKRRASSRKFGAHLAGRAYARATSPAGRATLEFGSRLRGRCEHTCHHVTSILPCIGVT